MMGYPATMVAPDRLSPAISRTNHIPADYRTWYVQSWHFTVQREIGRGDHRPGLCRKIAAALSAFTDINAVTSGQPVNLTYSPTSQFWVSGYPTYRANVPGDVMGPESERPIDKYFITANLVLPTDPRFPFGNAGRNIARGYSFHQADMGCTRISCWRARAADWSAGPSFSIF
jgi:hypothetical protein